MTIDMCIAFFFRPREKVGRKTPAPLFRAEIRVSKTRRREAETGLGGRHPITTGPHCVKGCRSRVVWEFNPLKRPVYIVSRRLPRKVNPTCTREGVGPFERESETEVGARPFRRNTSILTCDKRRIYVAMSGRARVQRSRSIAPDSSLGTRSSGS